MQPMQAQINRYLSPIYWGTSMSIQLLRSVLPTLPTPWRVRSLIFTSMGGWLGGQCNAWCSHNHRDLLTVTSQWVWRQPWGLLSEEKWGSLSLQTACVWPDPTVVGNLDCGGLVANCKPWICCLDIFAVICKWFVLFIYLNFEARSDEGWKRELRSLLSTGDISS